ncbi:MAG: hypothetical protein NZM16_00480, partial [Thermoflexus sp.]|uniref:hypothetical protein n=1 Tax=Thermoflexus sp. TaxID=1969742 RepID=UPI0025D7AE55
MTFEGWDQRRRCIEDYSESSSCPLYADEDPSQYPFKSGKNMHGLSFFRARIIKKRYVPIR